jgi:hypothetical protein
LTQYESHHITPPSIFPTNLPSKSVAHFFIYISSSSQQHNSSNQQQKSEKGYPPNWRHL